MLYLNIGDYIFFLVLFYVMSALAGLFKSEDIFAHNYLVSIKVFHVA